MLDELFDFSEPVTLIAMGLAVIGAFGAYMYAPYLGTGATIGLRIFTALATLVIGYIVAFMILSR